ncbi:glycosyltransferase [Pseudoalteromonas sp. SWN29]|uniref:glycosyltransferase family 2 protein n=1 Tax=Pseudoalteromonas sp. SWN29 TaxID=2792064 RepID=UPI0018CE9890|nr:glycosyltransferase [Pseudoalteromonas sp. SWN29]MBH0028974.1 glycosyltransferase [Pseudoalteromonas sp. SWN29]
MHLSAQPLVSILMPVYNCAPFLNSAIESILNQTYKNFELLIIDDGSTDTSLGIIKHYSSVDKRIRFISRENKGLIDTINEMVTLAEGDYIARMDGDDISLPTRIERQLTKITSEESIILVGCWIKLFGERSETWHYRRTNDESQVISLFARCCLTHASFLAHKSLFQKYPFNPNYTHLEDLDFLNRVIRGENGKILSIPETLYQYRIHNSSICNTFADIQKQRRIELLQTHLKHYRIQLNVDQLNSYFKFCEQQKVLNISQLKEILLEVCTLSQHSFPDCFLEFELRWRTYCKRFNFPYESLDSNLSQRVSLL